MNNFNLPFLELYINTLSIPTALNLRCSGPTALQLVISSLECKEKTYMIYRIISRIVAPCPILVSFLSVPSLSAFADT